MLRVPRSTRAQVDAEQPGILSPAQPAEHVHAEQRSLAQSRQRGDAQALVAGFCMACPESGDTAQQDLREIGPTFYFAPPRVFESLLTRVMIRMEDASGLKKN